MTVGELIEILNQYPKDSLVFRETSEYMGAEAEIGEITYRDKISWPVSYVPSILIK